MAKRSALDSYERVEVRGRAELRAWLETNHRRETGVWLVSYKKIAGAGLYLPYGDIVEEVLCFGWIDSLPRKLDERRSMLLITPRRAGSAWSAVNKERIAKLEPSGLLTPPGRDAIERAKADGSWGALDAVERLEVPDDLKQALREAGATRGFNTLAPFKRKGLLTTIAGAKRPETREKRVGAAVRAALEVKE